jgi:hypothetical protein
MHVLVVYESLFGNTRDVAEAIAEGLRDGRGLLRVDCISAAERQPADLPTADLLVVGGPTHNRGMATRASVIKGRQLQRRLALTKQPVPSRHRAELLGRLGRDGALTTHVPKELDEQDAVDADLQAWLRALPRTSGRSAAAFDTRLGSRWSGGAANGIARRLRRHGYRLLVPPEGYVLESVWGPLRADETTRARSWGSGLRRQLVL